MIQKRNSFPVLLQNMQDEMTDLMDVSNEIQETLGRNYNVPDYIDEEELMGGKLLDSIQRLCFAVIEHDLSLIHI